MILLTEKQIVSMAPNAKGRVIPFLPYLNDLCPVFAVDSPIRLCHFLAQLCHESGEFKYTSELASGAAYENRRDLGNTIPGDGKKYKGRGLIQLTGKTNYKCYNDYLIGEHIMDDVLNHPELVAQPEHAVRSALWFWATRKLNALADKDDILRITKRINGGTNGLRSRTEYYNKARKIFMP